MSGNLWLDIVCLTIVFLFVMFPVFFKPKRQCHHRHDIWPGDRIPVRTITGVGLGWDARVRLSADWTGPCRYCGENFTVGGLVPLNAMPEGYSLDDNGWPIRQDGTKMPRSL